MLLSLEEVNKTKVVISMTKIKEEIKRKVRIELTTASGDDERTFDPIVESLRGTTNVVLDFEIEHYVDFMGASAMRLFAISEHPSATIEILNDCIITALADCLLGVY